MLQMKQRRLVRTVDTKDFVENGQITVDLPLGYDLNAVIVRLYGTITVGTAATAYHTHGVPRLIDRLDLFSNGKNKFAEITGMKACLGNFERKLANTLTDISAGTGAKTVDAYFRIDLDNADGPRPKDSALHTNKPFMSKLQLKIATNDFDDMALTLGSFAVSSHALRVEVMVEETIEFEDAAYFESRLVKVQSLIEETIDATKSNHKIKLATGELLTRGVYIFVLDETGALSNAVINSVQLKSGVDVAFSKNWTDVRELNKAAYGLQGSQLPAGVAFVDLCPDGKLTQLWDTRGRSELDLVLDVTKPAGGDATVIAIPLQFYEQDNTNLLKDLGAVSQ